MLRPQLISHRRERHRRAGMPAIRSLDCIHRERADRVDRGLVDTLDDGGHRVRRMPACGCKQRKWPENSATSDSNGGKLVGQRSEMLPAELPLIFNFVQFLIAPTHAS